MRIQRHHGSFAPAGGIGRQTGHDPVIPRLGQDAGKHSPEVALVNSASVAYRRLMLNFVTVIGWPCNAPSTQVVS